MNKVTETLLVCLSKIEPYANIYILSCSEKEDFNDLSEKVITAIRALPEPLRSREDYRIMFEVWQNLRAKLKELQ